MMLQGLNLIGEQLRLLIFALFVFTKQTLRDVRVCNIQQRKLRS